MSLSFLNRTTELARLRAVFARRDGSLAVLYGRRRCGKSRLVQEALPPGRSVYYVADDRESALQRPALAVEIGRLVPGFAEVAYPDWEALFARWRRDARPDLVLALDEFPALVTAAREIPSLLQKHVDTPGPRPHLVLAGSSQRMMHGLVLDRSAPLFGRAREILKIGPLPAGWILRAFGRRQAEWGIEAFAVWGGVPRYWELATEYPDILSAVEALILSPLGVLYQEPLALLADDLREVTQASSVLALIGAGCHRLSEIAGRLGKPATSLTRPLARLIDLGLVRRDVPFGTPPRDAKRSLYQIDDPFLRFWFRFVEPNRSRLEARLAGVVRRELALIQPAFVAGGWEDLVRASVPRAPYFDRQWGPASSWWGPGLDARPLEIDVVAESADGRELLIGEAKWQQDLDWPRESAALQQKAARFPAAQGRTVHLGIWSRRPGRRRGTLVQTFTPRDVLRALT